MVSYAATIINSNPNLDGYGTVFQPYQITSPEELDMIREDMNAHYILCDDIDLSSISSWKPIGSENSKFRGSFNGNGHVISNINISARYSRGNTPFTSVYVGLFGYVYRSEISNLRIENATYTVTSDDYDDDRYINIGGIIGAAKQSRIEQCYFFGTINGSVEDNANIRESGIVAVGIQSEIVDCCNNSILNASAKNNKTLIAGISALLDESSIDKCLSASKISGESAEGECFIGGINACGESGNWYNRKEASTVKKRTQRKNKSK